MVFILIDYDDEEPAGDDTIIWNPSLANMASALALSHPNILSSSSAVITTIMILAIRPDSSKKKDQVKLL